jgi:hypothetical protein
MFDQSALRGYKRPTRSSTIIHQPGDLSDIPNALTGPKILLNLTVNTTILTGLRAIAVPCGATECSEQLKRAGNPLGLSHWRALPSRRR